MYKFWLQTKPVMYIRINFFCDIPKNTKKYEDKRQKKTLQSLSHMKFIPI